MLTCAWTSFPLRWGLVVRRSGGAYLRSMPSSQLKTDVVLGVAIPSRNARGRIGRLGPVVDSVLANHGYPPAIEKLLNEMGISTFQQVAGLTPPQIEEVEAEAGFRGRIGRNNWLQQAEVLARGGVEEYRRVFGKDPK